MRESLRPLLAMLAVALGSLWLTTPAVAWTMHATAHVGNPVTVDQHHDHVNPGGTVLNMDQDAPDHQQGHQDKSGHDHMASALAFLSATVDAGQGLAPPPSSSELLESSVVCGLRDVRPPPLARPPRSN